MWSANGGGSARTIASSSLSVKVGGSSLEWRSSLGFMISGGRHTKRRVRVSLRLGLGGTLRSTWLPSLQERAWYAFRLNALTLRRLRASSPWSLRVGRYISRRESTPPLQDTALVRFSWRRSLKTLWPEAYKNSTSAEGQSLTRA